MIVASRPKHPVLRQAAILAMWSFATWASLILAGTGRADANETSLGTVVFGLYVSFIYVGPFFALLLGFFQRQLDAGLRLVVGSWLMTNILAHGILAHEDAVLREEIGDCPGIRVFQDRGWPYEGYGVVCNDGEWFAHD